MKRFLAFLMSVLMIVSVIVPSVAADEETAEPIALEALAALPSDMAADATKIDLDSPKVLAYNSWIYGYTQVSQASAVDGTWEERFIRFREDDPRG